MKTQRGSALIALLAVGAILLTLTGVCFSGFVSARTYAINQEALIKKVYNNNQNILGTYTNKVREMAQVPDMYASDLQKVMTSVMAARMGPEGSKAVVQWFKEANIPFDSSLYTKLQQVMEAGNNEFQVNQTRLVEVKEDYAANQQYLWRGFWMSVAGYPKINLDDFKIVVAEDTAKAFEEGNRAPIKLR